jgi:uncharacterized protein YqgC (DUF456 family)
MTFEQIIGLSLALFIMLIGLAGSILPGLPSTPFILAAAVGHRLYFGSASASNLVLILLTVLTLFSLLLDYVASMIGAQKLGATWRGALGAVVGALIGLFFTLPGIILGPFLGALIFEMAGGREFDHAARAGVGAVLGLLAGAVGKFACCIAMLVLFTFSAVSRAGGLTDGATGQVGSQNRARPSWAQQVIVEAGSF